MSAPHIRVRPRGESRLPAIVISDKHSSNVIDITPAEARALAAELIRAAALCEGRCPECDWGWCGSYPCDACTGTGKDKA